MKIKTLAQLKSVVEAMQYAVAGVEDLNSGGCGVFAAIACNRLRKLGLDPVVRVGDGGADPDALIEALDSGAKDLCDLNNNGIYFDHLIVEVKWRGRYYHFDSETFGLADDEKCGVYDTTPLLDGYLTPEFVMKVARDTYGWNHWFDRSKIPAMIKNIRYYLNEALDAINYSQSTT